MYEVRQLCLLMAAVACTPVQGETYKCMIDGRSVISDTPCRAAQRVDQSTDSISRDQRRQAEIVNARNRSQLSELEYRAAQNRYAQGGGVSVIDSMQPPPSAPSRKR